MDWLKPLNPRGEASAGDNNDTQVAWLRVMQGEASTAQITVARKVFATHLADISLSVAGYHAITYNLPDGSRLRIVSNSGIHHATLWPTSVVLPPKLPHGFAVVTNWAAPKIFKRVVTVDPPTVEWKADPTPVPQCRTDLEGENQVFRANSATTYFNHPMVLTDGSSRSRWDYLKHSAPALVSANPVVPLCTQAGADYSTRVVHYGVDNIIKNGAGADIYTMPLSPAILTVDPETPVHVPAATTAAGTEVLLQHIRLAIISPTFGIYTARFANERLARLDEANYSLTERNVVSFTGPIGGSTPSGGASSSSLGETIDGSELFLRFATRGSSGSVGFATYDDNFNYTNAHDLTPNSTTEELATREVGDFSSASEVLTDTLVLPEAIGSRYPQLIVNDGIGGSVNWRAGYLATGLTGSSPEAYPDYSSQAWYGAWRYRKERIDAQYLRRSAPSIAYPLGWTNLYLLAGVSKGECTGTTYTDIKVHGRDQSQWDGGHLLNTYLVTGTAPPYFGVDRPGWEATMSAMDVKAEVIAYLEPAFPATLGVGTTTTTVLADERPINTGSYTYTSRYVIDFDHKGQFYAAIKVSVECLGAQWRESGYQGNMVAYNTPTYRVNISLETRWKDVEATTGLFAGDSVRPAFEFTPIFKQNPYYFLQPLEFDKQTMIVRVPPTFGLPMEALTQIKNIATHQGVNPHLVCADVRDDITGPAVAKTQSRAGIEFSTIEGGAIRPHTKCVTGQLYARTFKLSDFPDALWLLHSTKCDAKENDGATGPAYFYFPALKTLIDNQTFHIEVRDGVHETWSDEFMPGPDQPPLLIDRDIKLYRV